MFVFALAVPALLVVVFGYVVGYAVAEWVGELFGAAPSRVPEVAGWTTGIVLLVVVVRALLAGWRRRRSRREDHQK